MAVSKNCKKSDSIMPGMIIKIFDHTKRAFSEFLLTPTLVIIGLLLLLLGSYVLDHSNIPWLDPFKYFMKRHFLSDAQSTREILSTIAESVITMAALTVTLLLIVVQQTAASLTPQVFDQFLRRHQNQFYFGFFIGLALYTLILLTTVGVSFNPIYGITLDFILTFIALYLLIVLVYTTINQIRPDVIIEAIHDHILAARERQLEFIQQTRRTSAYQANFCKPLVTTVDGSVTRINLDLLKKTIEKAQDEVEIVLEISVGSYVAFGDLLANIKAANSHTASDVCEQVRHAIHIEQQRNVIIDPAYGIEQLQMIGWTSISTAKANPMPGIQVIRNLRDILARWDTQPTSLQDRNNNKPLAIVYKDNVMTHLMDTFESLAIIASESMQHQNLIEILYTFLIMFDRVSSAQQQRINDIVPRLLSTLGDFVLTSKLNQLLIDIAKVLQKFGYQETANQVSTALQQFQSSVGNYGSRSERVNVR